MVLWRKMKSSILIWLKVAVKSQLFWVFFFLVFLPFSLLASGSPGITGLWGPGSLVITVLTSSVSEVSSLALVFTRGMIFLSLQNRGTSKNFVFVLWKCIDFWRAWTCSGGIFSIITQVFRLPLLILISSGLWSAGRLWLVRKVWISSIFSVLGKLLIVNLYF